MQSTGIVTRRQLIQQGWDGRQITAALESAAISRIRQGFYRTPDAPPDLVTAVRVGGMATGPTALRWYGVWSPPDHRIHVAVSPNGSRLRDVDDQVVVHWASARFTPKAGPLHFRPVVPLSLAIEHAMIGVPPEFAVAIGDSALHEHKIGLEELEAIVATLPRRVRRAIAHRFNARSESGIESIARYLLECVGIATEVQVRIDGVGRVDLLIDGWLIVELDGGHHAEMASMKNDRRRDAAAIRRGYRTVRFSYDDVMFRWPDVLQTIRVALAEGAPVGIRSA